MKSVKFKLSCPVGYIAEIQRYQNSLNLLYVSNFTPRKCCHRIRGQIDFSTDISLEIKTGVLREYFMRIRRYGYLKRLKYASIHYDSNDSIKYKT